MCLDVVGSFDMISKLGKRQQQLEHRSQEHRQNVEEVTRKQDAKAGRMACTEVTTDQAAKTTFALRVLSASLMFSFDSPITSALCCSNLR